MTEYNGFRKDQYREVVEQIQRLTPDGWQVHTLLMDAERNFCVLLQRERQT